MEQKNPLISIIIPCYNYAYYLPFAVYSALNQTYQNIEIIIVDDGSTDNTKEVVNKIKKDTKDKKIPIKYIYQKNKGLAATQNTGIKNSKGIYHLSLDADDLLFPTMVQRCLIEITNYPNFGFVYPFTYWFGTENGVCPTYEYNFNHLLQACIVTGCALVKKEAWQKVGGYDNQLSKMGGFEDWDYWISLGEKEIYGKLIPEPLYFYRQHDTSMLKKAKKTYHNLSEYIYKKHKKTYDYYNLKPQYYSG